MDHPEALGACRTAIAEGLPLIAALGANRHILHGAGLRSAGPWRQGARPLFHGHRATAEHQSGNAKHGELPRLLENRHGDTPLLLQ